MKQSCKLAVGTLAVLLGLAVPTASSWAQTGGTAPPPAPALTVYQAPPAAPAPAADAPDVNAHLPSSGKASSDISSTSDGFDLSRKSGSGSAVRGSKGSAYVVSGQYVPDLHTAKRGDTLWDISARYFGNPYNWPRIWALNRQVQNPHWIYPGDHLRLRGNYVRQVGLGVGFSKLQPLVSSSTQFTRFTGFVLDGKHPVWGEIVGSPDDQMLLSESDEVYVQLRSKRSYKVGQKLVVFEPRKVKSLSKNPLVWIRGIIQLSRYNAKTGMARATIIESLDVIERGVKVGPLTRKVDVVAPKRNKKTVRAHIIGALYPHQFYGQYQVVFIDRGTDHGLEVGNRLFAVSRGDQWRLGLHRAGKMATKRALTEDDRMARVEPIPKTDTPRLYPAETYAELMVTRLRKKTATCLVTASLREIPRGAIVIARKGY